MSIKDYAKSLVAEVTGAKNKQPSAGVNDESLADEKPTPKPNEPDPQEVQYPGYFKDEGSL